MSRKKNISPAARKAFEDLKYEIARELGVYNTVKEKGWGDVSSRNCGNIVKKALEMRERGDI
ncbi:small, acid-soluble spore protein, alpha/beta type [Dethiothermospora halolimnae]|uniref:small, acid-soluble spore protein, alpha/beta type n=1 Tax=Dethiothermospora halolimnae TaxID=3114390 RepID=UPI003CCC3B61